MSRRLAEKPPVVCRDSIVVCGGAGHGTGQGNDGDEIGDAEDDGSCTPI